MEYDVIIAGGGSAGVAAAVASARSGARTLLVERYPCLGGAATMRNVITYCGLYTLSEAPQLVVGGIPAEVVERLARRDAITGPIRHRGVFTVFDPENLKAVLDDIMGEAGVDVLLNSFIISAERDGNNLQSVTFASHGGQVTCRAKAFVDCTGDGDLAAFGGASTRYGNDGTANLATLATRFGGIAPNTEIGVEKIIDAVERCNFEPGMVTKDRSVVVRLPISGDLVVYLASADYDPRDPASKSAAEAYGRQQAWNYLKAIRTIAGCENAYLVSTGPEFGTRESRHLNCRYQLSWDDIEKRREFEDCVALGAWGAEWHERGTFESSFEYPPEKSAYGIPLGCLHSKDTGNLFCAGRLADGDRKAGAAIRVMGTAMATGQAAGVAAALEANGAFSSEAVREKLRQQGALLELPVLQGAA